MLRSFDQPWHRWMVVAWMWLLVITALGAALAAQHRISDLQTQRFPSYNCQLIQAQGVARGTGCLSGRGGR